MRNKIIYTLVISLLTCTSLFAGPRTDKQTFIYSIKGSDTLRLDKYDNADITGQKPCVIFVFGGGFFSGARDLKENVDYMNLLAEKGYTAVSIDYRLGFKDLKDKKIDGKKELITLFENTIDMSVEDLFDATTFVYNHADEWNINKDMIVANGSSAGGIAVLQGEYYICNKTSLTQKLPEGFNYVGVIAFAGAIYSNTGKPKWKSSPCPVQLFHGDADSNVPFNRVRILKYGLFGSKYIVKQLDKMKLPYYFYKVENAAHDIAVKPMKNNITEISRFIDEYVIAKKPLNIVVDVIQLDKPERKKKFGLKDYIRANFSL